MNLLELIKQTDLDIVERRKAFSFKNELYKVVQARRSEEVLEQAIISEYFFVDFTDSFKDKMFGNNFLINFQEFQTKLLSQVFFSHKGDLRWNVYLLLVIEKYEDLQENSILQEIEDDENYARKYIITANDAINLINKKWLSTSDHVENELTDPINIWYSLLAKESLSGCMNGYTEKQLDKFIDGELLTDELVNDVKRDKYEIYQRAPEKIMKIELEKYRDHCFKVGQSLETSKVNLVHGSNGSGKTSMLESIELALTNEVRRCKPFNDPLSQEYKVNVVCKLDLELQNFKSGQDPAFYKKLEENWYGIPTGKARTTINYYFNRYNYFDSDAAYLFTKEESEEGNEKFDYSDNLSRLVYGEKILRIQKNWMKYKEEFDKRIPRLNKEFLVSEEKFLSVKEQISKITPEDFPSYLEMCLIGEETRLKKVKWSDKLHNELLEVINTFLVIADNQIINIKSFSHPIVPLSVINVKNEQRRLNEKLTIIDTEIKKNMELSVEYQENLDNVYSDIKISEQRLDSLQKKVRDIEDSLNIWGEVSQIIHNNDKIEQRAQLKLRTDKLQNSFYILEEWTAKYADILHFTENHLEIIPELEVKRLREEIQHKELEYKELLDQIEIVTALVGDISALRLDIKQSGEYFLKLEHDASECPLCGTSHGTHDNLEQAILKMGSIVTKSDELLLPLTQKRDVMYFDLEKLKKRIVQHDKNILNIDRFLQAVEEFNEKTVPNIQLEVPYSNVLQQLLAVPIRKKQLETEIEEITRQVNALEQLGFNDQSISKGENFAKENEIFLMYQQTSMTDGTKFEQYIANSKSQLEIDCKKLVDILEDLIKSKEGIIEKISKPSTVLLDKDKMDIDNKIKDFSNLINQFDLLSEDFDLTEEDDLSLFTTQLTKNRAKVELILSQINRTQERDILIKELILKEEVYKNSENQLKRCKLASTTIATLPALKEFSERFIQENITKIEQLFKLLHTPREFDHLYLEEGGLVLSRNNRDEKVKAYQMSSGQRASLALSVMFTLHLAAPNAPKFIMMDEPVANMDDLHLLNLLDVLRDLALSGRQIFFTTANPDVANLFRRKFSFFEAEFTHFEFMRNSNQQVEIKRQYYKPELEEPYIEKIG